MSPDSETIRSAAADAVAAPLDLLLTDAAIGALRRANPGGSGLRLAAALAGRPRLVAGRGRQLLGELARIAVGTSQVQPSRRDRRFADPGWAGNPLLRRAMQAYLAAAGTAEGVVADAGLDWADSERVGFGVTNLIDALAPSNNPLLNPAALKAAIDTGGGSTLAGLRHFVADMAAAPRVPSMVEPDAFEVGVDLAVTSGSVILRTPVFELIQYRPATAAVRQVPLLIVPPTINKYYVMDLAPGRSLAEYLTGSALQVFMISWRNPDARHEAWDLNTYGQAVLDAMDAAARITGSEQTALMGACSGGIIAAMVAAHLADTGQQDRLAALTLMVTVLDEAQAGLAGAVIDERTVRLAAAASRARGYLDGRSLAEVFAWLRPNDLIWNYWVNNYLLGRTPPPFDILFWNADTTRMTAGLHRDFLQLGATNALVRPGGVTMLVRVITLRADPQRAKVKLGEYAARWITQRANLRPRTVEIYSGLLKRHIVPYFGNIPLGKIDTAIIREWRATLLTNGVGESEVAKAYRFLRAVLMTAADDWIIPRNPCRIRGAGEEKPDERPVLTVDQVFKLIKLLPERTRALVLLATFVSLRWGEAVALRRSDLDLESATVSVRLQQVELDTGNC